MQSAIHVPFTDLKDRKTEKLFHFLKKSAQSWQLVPYEDAAYYVDLPAWRKPFTHRLGAISAHTWEKHGIIITALIVGKHSGVPNAVFYDFLKPMMPVPDDEAGRALLWAKLVRDAHKHYGSVQ